MPTTLTKSKTPLYRAVIALLRTAENIGSTYSSYALFPRHVKSRADQSVSMEHTL